jgi:peptide/nickel transport system permease protein
VGASGRAKVFQQKHKQLDELMGAYLIQRFLLLIPTFIGVTIISFLIMRLAPGDPAELRAGGGLRGAGESGISTEKRGAVDQAVAQWRAQYGLDKPLPIQYAIWMKNLFTLNFGESYKDNQPVVDKIRERLPVTVKLNVLSIFLVYLVAIPLGIYSATHSYSIGDQVTTLFAFVLFALPVVWRRDGDRVSLGAIFSFFFRPAG